MSALLEHFTRDELLEAAEAAEPYPPGFYTGWGVSESGERLKWSELHKAAFL